MKDEIDCRCSITFITYEMGGKKKTYLKVGVLKVLKEHVC